MKIINNIKKSLSIKITFINFVLISIFIIFILGYVFLILPNLYYDYQYKELINNISNNQNLFVKNENIKELENRILKSNQYQINILIDKRTFDFKVYTGVYYLDTYSFSDSRNEKLKQLFVEQFGKSDITTNDFINSGSIDIFFNTLLNICLMDLKSFLPLSEEIVFNENIEEKTDNTIIISRYVKLNSINMHQIGGYTFSENYILFNFINYNKDYINFLPLFNKVFIVIVLYFIIINIIFSEYILRIIIEPIKNIIDFSKLQMNKKKFEKISNNRSDEIGELIDNLNILHEKIYDYNEILKKENIQKDLFIKSSSHQLKTPIASVIMLTNSIIDGVGKYKDRDKYLLELKNKLINIKNMIDSILVINTYDENIKNNLNIREIVCNLVLKYEKQIIDNNLTYEVEGDLKLFVNENMMVAILDNLIENAVKYTKNSKIQVILNDNYIKVINFDSSIKKENLENIFKPFYREVQDNTGTGLGLYITKNYVEKLGFNLNVISDKNTEFTLIF